MRKIVFVLAVCCVLFAGSSRAEEKVFSGRLTTAGEQGVPNVTVIAAASGCCRPKNCGCETDQGVYYCCKTREVSCCAGADTTAETTTDEDGSFSLTVETEGVEYFDFFVHEISDETELRRRLPAESSDKLELRLPSGVSPQPRQRNSKE
jgi:hypothetical protein